jgi:ribosomal protein S12 methylthiotransferase
MRTDKASFPAIQKVSVITLGCSKNTVDSENLMGRIEAHNMQLSEPEQADALIINTCGFIDKAKEESINTILEGVRLREDGSLKKLIVAGCLSERYGDDLKAEIPEVDHFFGTTDFDNILKVLTPDLRYNLIGERVLTTPKHYAYMKISEGCDNPCSFCAIPIMRGKHRSRPMEELVAEAAALVRRGVRELVLIAQDLTCYGLDIYGKRSLDELMRRLSDVDGVLWIRLMYAYPSKFPREILPVMAERSNIAKYLDMPLQHASTNMLKAMRRGITRRTTEDLLAHIRDTVPGITLRTTFIVGYPSETDAEFEELCDFVRQQEFGRMGVFEYSQEDDTYAAILGDPIPAEIKQERSRQLMEIQREISLRKNTALIGSVLPVLIEEQYDGEYQGRSEFDAPEVDNEVFVRSEEPLAPGDVVLAEITDAAEFDIFGEFRGKV